MRYSISIPQFDVDGFDSEGLRSYLTRAEVLGFEGGWTLEQVIGPAGLRRIYGTMPGVDAVRCRAHRGRRPRAAEVFAPRAQTLLLNPTGASLAEDREQMERLAAEVIPQLS